MKKNFLRILVLAVMCISFGSGFGTTSSPASPKNANQSLDGGGCIPLVTCGSQPGA